MRTLVMGSGGLGGYVGGVLSRAGLDVTFIARGSHLDALQQRGLSVHSRQAGSFHLAVQATDDPEPLGRFDLVIFAVKSYQLEQAAAQIAPVVGPRTMVLPLQIGVDTASRLGRYVPPQQILGCVSTVRARLEAPGVIVQTSGTGLIFGELTGGSSPRAERLAAALTGAGLVAELRQDMLTVLWEHYLLACAAGCSAALARRPLAVLLQYPDATAVIEGLLTEAAAVARACRVDLAPDAVKRLSTAIRADDPLADSRLLDDLQAGRPLELEALTGALLRLGRQRDVETPLSQVVHLALLPHRDGALSDPDPRLWHQPEAALASAGRR